MRPVVGLQDHNRRRADGIEKFENLTLETVEAHSVAIRIVPIREVRDSVLRAVLTFRVEGKWRMSMHHVCYHK